MNEQWLESVSQLKDELVEEFVQQDLKAHNRKWFSVAYIDWARRRFAAVRLSLILIVVLAGNLLFPDVWISRKAPWIPNTAALNKITVNTEVFDNMFGQMMGSTNQYIKVYGMSMQDLEVLPIPNVAYLPIYQIGSDPDQGGRLLDAFMEKYRPALDGLFGSNPTVERQTHEVEGIDYHMMFLEYSDQSGRTKITTTLRGTQFRNERYTSYFGSTEEKRITMDGKFLYLSASDSDCIIRRKLKDLQAELNERFGKNYSDVKVVRTYHRGDRVDQYELYRITVYFYTPEENDLPEYISGPYIFHDYVMNREHLALTFQVDQGYGSRYHWKESKDRAFLTDISVAEAVMPWDEYYQTAGKARMLSLREAEKLLDQGYVFAGYHSCPMCRDAQEAVSFDRYDGVGLEYLTGGNGMVVPFYAFFKEIDVDESSGVRCYAKTYVPAVEIDGLDEYFEIQMTQHDS